MLTSKPTTADLRILHDACTRAALPRLLGALSPLAGHCDVVAELVLGLFGGVIVTGRVEGLAHFWNRLPNGREVDLTSCQFGGDGLRPRKRGKVLQPQPKFASARSIIFGVKVRQVLDECEAQPC